MNNPMAYAHYDYLLRMLGSSSVEEFGESELFQPKTCYPYHGTRHVYTGALFNLRHKTIVYQVYGREPLKDTAS